MTEEQRKFLPLMFFMCGGARLIFDDLKAQGIGPALVWHPTAMQCDTTVEAIRVMRQGGWRCIAVSTAKEAAHHQWKLGCLYPEGVVSLSTLESPSRPEQLALPLPVPVCGVASQ